MYCHGYRGAPVRFDAHKPDAMAQTYAPLGYAVAQSGYSAGGYAVREAIKDTEALRVYFASQFGLPKETWVSGSYGKTLTFDQLVMSEYLFPGPLPSPARVPADFVTTWDRTNALERLLDSKPEAATTLRRFTGARSNKEQAANLDLFTHILGEQQRRWGGNPYDNRDTIYSGTGDDVRVNDGVKRYRADDGARALAIRDYTPTGRLQRPLLAVRAVFDPMIAAYPSDRYANIAQLAGCGDLFAQQYVRESGHDQLRPEQIRSAFNELRHWRMTSQRPNPGAVP
jgi:hypothetical protein